MRSCPKLSVYRVYLQELEIAFHVVLLTEVVLKNSTRKMYFVFKVKKKMEGKAEEECQRIAEELTNHLHNDETKQRMFQWHAGIYLSICETISFVF